MFDGYYGVVEMIFTFGLCVAFVVWQWRSVNRDIRARKEREARAAGDKARGDDAN